MNEIGELLRNTREGSGVSLEEASSDLEIKALILENIEEGNIGCFKDIFLLKDYVYNYAKYLGLEPEKIIDKFNEYLFEYTSKIPLLDIEKAMKEKAREEVTTDKVISPYTMEQKKKGNKLAYVLFFVAVILVVIIAVWAVKRITIDNTTTSMIGYKR